MFAHPHVGRHLVDLSLQLEHLLPVGGHKFLQGSRVLGSAVSLQLGEVHLDCRKGMDSTLNGQGKFTTLCSTCT